MTSYGNDHYSYDDTNGRIKKIENSETRYYISNNGATLSEYGENDSLEAEYIYGPSGMVAKLRPDFGYIWYYKDHLGSTRQMSEGNMERDYYPFGESKVASGDESAYQYSGKERDANTGLDYFGARYYNPSTGRWLSADPAHQDISPYLYTSNSPVSRIDPSGLWYMDFTDYFSDKYYKPPAITSVHATEDENGNLTIFEIRDDHDPTLYIYDTPGGNIIKAINLDSHPGLRSIIHSALLKAGINPEKAANALYPDYTRWRDLALGVSWAMVGGLACGGISALAPDLALSTSDFKLLYDWLKIIRATGNGNTWQTFLQASHLDYASAQSLYWRLLPVLQQIARAYVQTAKKTPFAVDFIYGATPTGVPAFSPGGFWGMLFRYAFDKVRGN